MDNRLCLPYKLLSGELKTGKYTETKIVTNVKKNNIYLLKLSLLKKNNNMFNDIHTNIVLSQDCFPFEL